MSIVKQFGTFTAGFVSVLLPGYVFLIRKLVSYKNGVHDYSNYYITMLLTSNSVVKYVVNLLEL